MEHEIHNIEQNIRKLRELIDIENNIDNKKRMEYDEYLLLCERSKLMKKHKNKNNINFCYLT